MNYEDLKVLFEDNHIIVVYKPQNIPCCADESKDVDLLSLVKEYIKVKYEKPGDAYVGLVHRLDRPTGGVMVFAKTSKAAERLSEQIKNGEMHKKYLCVVEGKPAYEQDKLTCYLKKYSDNIVKVVPSLEEGAKYAELDYKVLETRERKSLVKVNLITGRSHQIRVQMSTMGNPIVGDHKYGSQTTGFKNMCLWACELRFKHPISKQDMMFQIYPPEEDPWVLFNINQHLNLTIKNIY